MMTSVGRGNERGCRRGCRSGSGSSNCGLSRKGRGGRGVGSVVWGTKEAEKGVIEVKEGVPFHRADIRTMFAPIEGHEVGVMVEVIEKRRKMGKNIREGRENLLRLFPMFEKGVEGIA